MQLVGAEVDFGKARVNEILSVARHGVLRPVICRCHDEQLYFVKPSNCGAWALSMEWLCGRLAQALGLRIPRFRQVEISEELAQAWTELNRGYIAPGLGFGSAAVDAADQVGLENVPLDDQTAILWFDWWVRNTDRRSNNPNLIFGRPDGRWHLIDHEKAGGVSSADEFWQTHIFRSRRPNLPIALFNQMRAILPHIPAIMNDLPLEWTVEDGTVEWFRDQLAESLATQIDGTWIPRPQ